MAVYNRAEEGFPHRKVDLALDYLLAYRPEWSKMLGGVRIVPSYTPALPGEQFAAATSTDGAGNIFVDRSFASSAEIPELAGAIEFQLQLHVRRLIARMSWVPREHWEEVASTSIALEIHSSMRSSYSGRPPSSVSMFLRRAEIDDFASGFTFDAPPTTSSLGALYPEMLSLPDGLVAERYAQILLEAIAAQRLGDEFDPQDEERSSLDTEGLALDCDSSEMDTVFDLGDDMDWGEGEDSSITQDGGRGERREPTESELAEEGEGHERVESAGDEGRHANSEVASREVEETDGRDGEASQKEEWVHTGESEDPTGKPGDGSPGDVVERGGDSDLDLGDPSGGSPDEREECERDGEVDNFDHCDSRGGCDPVGEEVDEGEETASRLLQVASDLNKALSFSLPQMWARSISASAGESNSMAPESLSLEDAGVTPERSADLEDAIRNTLAEILTDDPLGIGLESDAENPDLLSIAARDARYERRDFRSRLQRKVSSAVQSARVAGSADTSLAVRNPHQPVLGPIMPGEFDYAPTVYCLQDVSGSMSGPYAKAAGRVLENVLEDVALQFGSNITWITADFRVRDISEISLWSDPNAWTFRAVGGSTDLSYIAADIVAGQLVHEGKKYRAPDVMVMITDGAFSWPQTRPKSKSRWVVVTFVNSVRQLPAWLKESEVATIESPAYKVS